ncbi:MAG: sulfite exporter TauE/SafE family protein [Dissulfuribacterales bacterium]
MNELFILVVVFVSTLVHAVFGFGSALVAMPLFAIFMGMSFATPFVALMCSVINVILAVRYWQNVYWRPAMYLLLSSVVGIPLGLWLLQGLDEDLLRFVLGLVIAGNSVFSLTKPNMPQLSNDGLAWIFGLISGALGGAYNTNGPPVVIYGLMRRWPPLNFIATLQWYFLTTGLLVVAWHGVSGLWTSNVLFAFVTSLPAIFAGIWLSKRLRFKLSSAAHVRYVHVLLILSGLLLMGRWVWHGFH